MPQEDHRAQVRAAETRLLYENANTGVAITVVIAVVLAYAHRDVVSQAVVVAWLAYMLVVSAARFVLAQQYWRASLTQDANGAMECGVRRRSRARGRWLGRRGHRPLPVESAHE